MSEFRKFIVYFKPVSGGYVYRAPNTWLFGSRLHFLVTEAQKAAIVAIVSSTVGPVLWTTGATWIALSALLGTAFSLWTYSGGYYGPIPAGISLMTSMMLSIYPAFVLSRQLLLRRLRPILATLPPTSERITSLEERQAIQAVPPRANFTYSTKNSQGRRSRSDGSGSWCHDLASDRYIPADPVGITHAVPGQHQRFRDTQHSDHRCIRICIRDLWTQLESGMTRRTAIRFNGQWRNARPMSAVKSKADRDARFDGLCAQDGRGGAVRMAAVK